MSLLSNSSSNIQNDTKFKKTFRKAKNKSNYMTLASSNTNEIPRKDTSVQSSISSTQKVEKINITQSSKGATFSKEIGIEQDPQRMSKGKPFVTTLQDFPELKVCNDSSSSKFSAENNSTIGYNKSWGGRQKKNQELPSFSSVITNMKNKTDIGKKLTQSEGNNTAELSDVTVTPSKKYSSIEDSKKDLISAQEVNVQSRRNPNKKKRTDPVLINLYDILNVNKNLKRSQKLPKSKFQRHKDTEQLSGNYLDSSNPKRLRGKRREVKKKTLTNLKLAIIKERIIKQKLRENPAGFEDKNVNFIDSIDFKTEIKIYLKELNEKKLKQAEAIKNKINSNSENTKNEISPSERNKKAEVIPSVTPEGNFKFSSKFREYCDNIITPDLNSAISNLIKASVNLQDKSFLKDPIKAKARKRHVSGIREVKKYLNLKKAKLIIIAPNLEKLQKEGSLQDVINNLKSTAQAQNVPYAFALDRYKLGICTKKNLPVSAFAILNYEGIEELFHNALDLLQEAKVQFNEMIKNQFKKEEYIKTEEINNKVIASFMSAFQTKLKITDEKNDSD